MKIDWDDLRLFLTVARLGGLRASAEATGTSAPTLGRRIAALEKQVGQVLFVRSVAGYALTEAGSDLLARAEEVEAAMRGVVGWSEGTSSGPVVRLSVGAWMASFLADRIGELWQVEDRARLEFVITFDDVDVGRRAADIDLRMQRPLEPNLAQRNLGHAAHAIYSGRKRINGVEAGFFVGMSGDAGRTPAARWLEAHHGDRIGVRANDVQACRDFVAAGAGLTVLPCFIGDRDNRLARLGAPIPELGCELWQVTHADRRHELPIRRVSARLAEVLIASAPLLRGDTPRAWEASA
ncbi:LysR family transcriptional regulator [Devosia sp. CN2-171]|uniref:LysR family transcriptional regulator n=1 Tax=Devosia sp. CN2-171 TaxID=3400909 RepID=UPI003BF8EC83